MKILTAKELTVTPEAWAALDRASAPGKETLTDILTSGGHLQEREKLGLAILMIKSFRDIANMNAAIEKHKHVTLEDFSVVMTGFAISYALGEFELDTTSSPAPFLIPQMDPHDIESAEFIKLRGGRKVSVKEKFMPFTIQQFNEDHVAKVFELVYPKKTLGGRKEAESMNLVSALSAMMSVMDGFAANK